MHSYIKDSNYKYDFTTISGEVIHPNDWIIYKSLDDKKYCYTLAIDYKIVKADCCHYCLSMYDILSSTDDIVLRTNEDNSVCTITTDKYKYEFTKSKNTDDIENLIGGVYKAQIIELISVELVEKNNISSNDKYHLELDDNILNFYIDGVYQWSKIISTKYTSGIYFVLKDKIFTVIENGCGILDVFNLDGSLYKQIQTSMEYIEHSHIINSDDKPTFLRLDGFIWQPVFLRQYIDIESLFADKLKHKTISEYDDKYNDLDEEKLKSEDLEN